MTAVHDELLTAPAGTPHRFRTAFTDYFGDPDKLVKVQTLDFQGDANLGLGGVETRIAVVRAVLNCVWQGITTRTVRLYFGGSSVAANVHAYVPDFAKVRGAGKINVHLAIDFFHSREQRGLRNGYSVSRSGLLIHELTHALAGTIDVANAFLPRQCKDLADEDRVGPRALLVNAQSYASFVEDAFGAHLS
jgi:hypothetical protein